MDNSVHETEDSSSLLQNTRQEQSSCMYTSDWNLPLISFTAQFHRWWSCLCPRCPSFCTLRHFGCLFISGLCLLCNILRSGEQIIFSLWWNLGYNSQTKFGGHDAWFDFTTTHVSCFLQFDGNGVGNRTYHLSWHLKDKNGIINSANSLQNRASMSKWRTLACSFSILLPASDVRSLITWSHLSKQALPNLSSRPTAPNNTGKFMSEGSTLLGSKNLVS